MTLLLGIASLAGLILTAPVLLALAAAPRTRSEDRTEHTR